MKNPRTIEVTEEVDIPAKFLWQTISDFEHIDRWADLKIRSIASSGIGCKRTVKMESGALVTEQLLVRNDEKMIFSYGILAPNPYPMLDYVSTVTVEAIAAQRSRLRWIGSYVAAEGIDPARTDNLLRKVYVNGIKLLYAHFAESGINK